MFTIKCWLKLKSSPKLPHHVCKLGLLSAVFTCVSSMGMVEGYHSKTVPDESYHTVYSLNQISVQRDTISTT